MAKQLSYKRQTVEAVSAKGIFNEDATTITYLNEDKEEVTIPVKALLEKFASQAVALSIKTQTDEELELDSEE